MSNWKGIVGQSFSPFEFNEYCQQIKWNQWKPSFIVLHHTAVPCLEDCPEGFSIREMRNLEAYYRDDKKWNAGPHLFIDDKKIWVFTPLTTPGIHSPSWNSNSIGIKMLGDYELESFSRGRGQDVRVNTIAAMAALSMVLDLHPFTIKLHSEDPFTSHSCPGRNVRKLEIVQEVYHIVNPREEVLVKKA